jgi:hypothetical protein
MLANWIAGLRPLHHLAPAESHPVGRETKGDEKDTSQASLVTKTSLQASGNTFPRTSKPPSNAAQEKEILMGKWQNWGKHPVIKFDSNTTT